MSNKHLSKNKPFKWSLIIKLPLKFKRYLNVFVLTPQFSDLVFIAHERSLTTVDSAYGTRQRPMNLFEIETTSKWTERKLRMDQRPIFFVEDREV